MLIFVLLTHNYVCLNAWVNKGCCCLRKWIVKTHLNFLTKFQPPHFLDRCYATEHTHSGIYRDLEPYWDIQTITYELTKNLLSKSRHEIIISRTNRVGVNVISFWIKPRPVVTKLLPQNTFSPSVHWHIHVIVHNWGWPRDRPASRHSQQNTVLKRSNATVIPWFSMHRVALLLLRSLILSEDNKNNCFVLIGPNSIVVWRVECFFAWKTEASAVKLFLTWI